jgi:hypothetical protein
MQARIKYSKVAPGAIKPLYELEMYLKGCGLKPP